MAKNLDEPILPDDYPMYADYWYVVDGNLYRSDWHAVTVGWFKRNESKSEVRRCDIVGRQRLARAAIAKAEGAE